MIMPENVTARPTVLHNELIINCVSPKEMVREEMASLRSLLGC